MASEPRGITSKSFRARARILSRAAAQVAACLLALPALAACARDDASRGGGTVVIGAGNDLDAGNPLLSVDAWTNEVHRYVLFMPLLQLGPELEYTPYLAQSWELVGDTAVVFHLRHDVRWHDGAPTTAEDVLFTFQRATDPATGFSNSDYFKGWSAGEVMDSFTVRFHLEPRPDPLAGLPFTPIVPKHLLDTIPPERLRQAEFNRRPVGNGPFRFVSRRMNDRWVFEANDDFPEALGGRPRLDRVVWRVIPENSAQLTELRVGEVDLILQPRPEQVTELAERPELRAVVKPSRQFAFIVWNELRPPLDDARVRRALAMAVDREAILQRFRQGFGEVAVAPVLPSHWAYDDSLLPLPYAPDSARALLAAAGIEDRDGDGMLDRPDGDAFTIELELPAGSDYYRDIAEAVRHDLAGVGVRMSTRPTEGTTLFADLTSPKRNFDAALLGWVGDFRLDLHDVFHSEAVTGPYQFASYRNPRLDALMDAASAEPDRGRAIPMWHRVQGILLQDQPWTLLFYQTDAFLARERVHALDMDIRGALVHVTDWYVGTSSGPGR